MGKIKFKNYETTNGSFAEVFAGEYELPINFKPESVLDIGANEGAFTAWALAQWPDCRVDAYEPVPQNANLFRFNHGTNPRVKLSAFAISKDSPIRLHLGKNNSGEASRYDLGGQNREFVDVDAIAPDKLESAEFVKIDTEGCEVEILSNLDLSKTKALVCEYHRDDDGGKICAHMKSAGFDLVAQKAHAQNLGVLKFSKPGMLKKRSLFLAMPVYRVMDVFTCQSLIKLVSEQILNAEFAMKVKMHIGECPIGRARNDLTHEFLQSDATHILFVDSDISFSYEQVKKILFNDEDIIGGFYVKKQDGPVSPVCNTLNSVDQPRNDGLVKVKYMGTGFLRISRKVFEVMIQEKGREIEYVDDGDHKTVKHDFWRMGVAVDCVTGVKRWLSEDWQFCQFALECGFNVWADASILLQHSGTISFPLRTQLPELYSPEQLERMGLAGKKTISAGADKTAAADNADVVADSPPIAASA